MLTDNDFTVREEAVLALAWLSPRIDIVDELHNLLVFHLKNAPLRGLAAVLAQRKLEYIALMYSSGRETAGHYSGGNT